MYSRPFSSSISPQDIPEGYGGSAFGEDPAPPSAPAEAEEAPKEEEVREVGARASSSPLSSLFSGVLPLFGRHGKGRDCRDKFVFHDFFNGDFLLLVIAVLLLTGDRDDRCEENDENLWLLLVLLYFMK